jgi:hypothetical protein
LPVLRSFLKGGEAECYEGISINYVPNRKPVLIIYERKGGSTLDPNEQDGLIELQRIHLDAFLTNEELHQVMLRNGFVLKDESDQQRIRVQAQEQEYKERWQTHLRHEYFRWRELYVAEFREQVVGIPDDEWKKQQRFAKQQSHFGPIKDMLTENYDLINKKVAGALKKDRLSYATQYLLHHR